MKVLFITRKYPPSIGGMQNFSHGLITNYPGKKEAITLGKPQYHLVWFFPYALLKALLLVYTKKVDVVHLGDAALTPLGYALKTLTRKPVIFTAHGLDINFNHFLYQKIMPFFFKKMDHVICVSSATEKICHRIGIASDKTSVIPNGIDPQEWELNLTQNEAREQLAKKFDLDLTNKKILLSVGRLVKRKGFRWFVESVIPKLPAYYIYLIVGNAGETTSLKSLFGKTISEKELLKQSIGTRQLKDRVKLLGQINSEDLKVIYRAADVLVMPNIPVEGDMEGFGIVAIEAGIMGTPVVAARMEGMQSSVIEGQTGYLAFPKDTNSFQSKIELSLQLNPRKISSTIYKNFNWNKIGQKYQNLFKIYSSNNV